MRAAPVDISFSSETPSSSNIFSSREGELVATAKGRLGRGDVGQINDLYLSAGWCWTRGHGDGVAGPPSDR